MRPGEFYAQLRHSISFAMTMRYVKIKQMTVVDLLQKLVHARHCSRAVYIVITIDKDFFAVAECFKNSFHSLVHILHQPGIMQVRYLGPKEFFSLIKSFNLSLYQYLAEDWMDF